MRFRYGITGNYYFTSINKEDLIEVCNILGISLGRIKFLEEDQFYVLRIKSKKTKKLAKELYEFN